MVEMRRFGDNATFRFTIIVAYLALVCLLGGSARNDIATLVVLRPLAVLALAYALVDFNIDCWRQYKIQILIFGSLVVLTLLHVMPLPPGIWHALPYRGLISQIDDLAQIGEIWRPLSIAPERTWNAFYALLVPLAALLMICRLNKEERIALLPVIIAFGLISGLLGVLQIGGGPHSALYYYRISNTDSAIGLFANRNHQGVFLATLFPMLAIFASLPSRSLGMRRLRLYGSVVAGVILFLLVLLSGSRAGLVTALLGVLSTPLLFQPDRSEISVPRRGQKKLPIGLIAMSFGGLFLLTLGAIIFSRAASVDRIFAGFGEDVRWKIWAPSFEMAKHYFPAGSGIGTFVEAFQRDEPVTTLSPVYINHAHNDWLEILMTGGLPMVMLIIIGLGFVGAAIYRAWTAHPAYREVRLARMSTVILIILAAGSIVDYPLRTPLLACLAMVFMVWLGPRRGFSKSGLDATETGEQLS